MDTKQLAIDSAILDIIKTHGPLSVNDILNHAEKKHINTTKEYVNSLLYGAFREAVVRDRGEQNIPLWRIKSGSFEAAKGYETTLYNELLKQKIITPQNSSLDYEVENPRSKKTYHLDIAVWENNKQYDIEVDGFEHMRADARLSIQRQIKQHGEKAQIDIDWMDHESSYIDFSLIDNTLVNKWCVQHLDWCITYHEELLWPHDITRNMFLIDHGWRVMRLWNMEVKNELKKSLQEIREWLEP